MKTYIELECALAPGPLLMGDMKYSEDEVHKLDGSYIPVNKYFNKNEDKITNGYFYWNEKEKIMHLKMWIRSDEVDFFEKHIISGNLIPVNVRFTPDDIDDESVKNLLEKDIDKIERESR